MKILVAIIFLFLTILEKIIGSNDYGFLISMILINILIWMPKD